jgi:hypothetical protein
MCFREARQQTPDCDSDRGAAKDVADAVMWARTEGEYPLRPAMNIEACRVRKDVRVVVRGKRRWPYHHALEDRCSSDLGVASGNARKGEIAIAPETKAFFECVGTTAGLLINCANCSGYV